MKQYHGLGRRKEAVARVFMQKGKGNIKVNGKDYTDHVPVPHLQQQIERPLKVLEAINDFDFKVNVYGGGQKGQAEAIQLGIARALVKFDEENKPPLKQEKLLTRDPRVVERKKYGRKKARKSPQFSKR